MSKYINADEFTATIRKSTSPSGAEWIVAKVNEMPSADVRENIHGEWKTGNEDWGMYYCSHCRMEFVLLEGEPSDNGYNFCPNCGADMRGDTE